MKSKALKKTRAELAIIITRRAFKKYAEYVPADDIVDRVWPLLLHNRDKFIAAFTKRVRAPLYKITENRLSSKRHIFSFLRRLSSYYGNVLVSKRKSTVVNGKRKSVYYCISKSRLRPFNNLLHVRYILVVSGR